MLDMQGQVNNRVGEIVLLNRGDSETRTIFRTKSKREVENENDSDVEKTFHG